MKQLKPDYLRSQIIGIDTVLQTPFGERCMVYADYTASGRGVQFVEEYLQRILQLYANSHTEDDTSGRTTTQLLHQAEQVIKQAVNAGPDGCIIACGSGATGAIDRMQQIVGVKLPAASRQLLDFLWRGFTGEEQAEAFADYCRSHQPVVFVGPYEHHSNEVSWRESLATVVEVRLDQDGGIDLAHLERLLQRPEYQGRLRIGSFSAASNVTGMKSPVHEIAVLLHRYDALAFFDYAASAPYVEIDMNPPPQPDGGDASLDAVFISPHKFVGGPGASGVLVFDRRCYHAELPPSVAGGGTVDYVGPDSHDFIRDIETRENAGTPGILQTLRAALVFQIKQAVGQDVIDQREHAYLRQALTRWGRHPHIEILGNPDPERRIGIVSFNLKGPGGRYYHPRFITTLLDDLFGIQSRAGCSCAGPYGHKLLGIDDAMAEEFRAVIADGHCGIKPGWCRIGFHYLFDQAEVDYLLDAVEFAAEYGYRFLPLYRFDSATGLWHHAGQVRSTVRLSLDEALANSSPSGEQLSPRQRQQHYSANLAAAHRYAAGLEDVGGDEITLKGDQGALQFFLVTRESLED
ncbi:aminotransferase class V-fold PLP-dependent enzyme [Sedimenticola thiotaurini]|uniref:aminotransferase class V-fold PLP-dependent enzyme n=1 Tax=Sedimenticola thiotaurini TaxID=1543721 RepID=UPI00069C314A|nr:aminotransferase class V-fold PLP-dependent enzyme [Sedimenticola thiotaurini]